MASSVAGSAGKDAPVTGDLRSVILNDNGGRPEQHGDSSHAEQSGKSTLQEATSTREQNASNGQDVNSGASEETVVVRDLDTGRLINVQKVGCAI